MGTTIRRRDGGYFTIPNRWIDAGYMAQAPGSVTQVYLFLCRWADNESLAATQPVALIARKTGLSEDIARKAVRTLEAWGVLERQWKPGPGGKNEWTLTELSAPAPDFPSGDTSEKYPPTKLDPKKVGPQEIGAPYQPNSYQPDMYQPDKDSLSRESKMSPVPAGQRKTRMPIPDDWQPREATTRWAVSEGWSTQDTSQEVERFRDYYRETDLQRADWDVMFRQWLRNPATLSRRGRVSGNGSVPKYDRNGNYTVHGLLERVRELEEQGL